MIDKIKLYQRKEALQKRVDKIEIIRNDMYPVKFGVGTKLMIKNNNKIKIIDKILKYKNGLK